MMICDDCGMDTAPCTHRRGCRHKGRWEMYMVRGAIWETVERQCGCLCVTCLERRIGRHLQPEDFPSWPINDPDHPWMTPLLRSRILGCRANPKP